MYVYMALPSGTLPFGSLVTGLDSPLSTADSALTSVQSDSSSQVVCNLHSKPYLDSLQWYLSRADQIHLDNYVLRISVSTSRTQWH